MSILSLNPHLRVTEKVDCNLVKKKKSFIQSMIESPMRKAGWEGRRGMCGQMEQREPKAGTRPSTGCFEHARYRNANMDTHSRILQNLSDHVRREPEVQKA